MTKATSGVADDLYIIHGFTSSLTVFSDSNFITENRLIKFRRVRVSLRNIQIVKQLNVSRLYTTVLPR